MPPFQRRRRRTRGAVRCGSVRPHPDGGAAPVPASRRHGKTIPSRSAFAFRPDLSIHELSPRYGSLPSPARSPPTPRCPRGRGSEPAAPSGGRAGRELLPSRRYTTPPTGQSFSDHPVFTLCRAGIITRVPNFSRIACDLWTVSPGTAVPARPADDRGAAPDVVGRGRRFAPLADDHPRRHGNSGALARGSPRPGWPDWGGRVSRAAHVRPPGEGVPPALFGWGRLGGMDPPAPEPIPQLRC